eukprot:795999_1
MACFGNNHVRVQSNILAFKIADIKQGFNKQFHEVFQLKQTAIAQIGEMIDEIESIQKELGEGAGSDPITRPILSDREVPERVLEVEDGEVAVDKVLTKHEREAKEREEEEIRRRAAEAAKDDAPTRALHDMMSGTLASKPELSLLEDALPKEDWMDEVAEEDMSEEQKGKYLIFKDAERLLLKAREDRRKMLETQLKKLKNDISDTYRSFDKKIEALFESKLKVLWDVYVHELIIIRLMNMLLFNELSDETEGKFQKLLEKKRSLKADASQEFQEFKRTTELTHKKYEQMAAEVRSMEKNFKREFADSDDFVDILFKMYKSPGPSAAVRPRSRTRSRMDAFVQRSSVVSSDVPPRQQRKRSARPKYSPTASESTARMESMDPNVIDPFANVSTHRSTESGKDTPGPIDDSDMPDDIPRVVWDRFVEKKYEKMQKEIELNTTATVYNRMQEELDRLAAVDKHLHNEISNILRELTELQTVRESFALNSELVLSVKQGQVEVEEAPVVTDLKPCEMVGREVIVELNSKIENVGEEKVGVLKDIKEFRKGINMLLWKSRRLDLDLQDYVDQTTEFQLLRVTKDLQELIKVGGHESRQAGEVSNLERKLDFLEKVTREKIQEKRQTLLKSQRRLEEMTDENDRLTETVRELEVSVQKRKQICDIREGRGTSMDPSRAARKRMEKIVTRRKLLDLASAQGDEIDFLRGELDRLRRRTFPSFAQAHGLRAGFVDER